MKQLRSLRKKGTPSATIDLLGGKKTALRTQFGALCYRMRKGKPEILLVTSRRTRRWIIPKGWPQDGARPSASAAQEAYEEAGVEGRAYDISLGLYHYTKTDVSGRDLPCVAMVYPLRVKVLHDSYRERHQRKRKWFRPAEAARRVSEPELAHILRCFDPSGFSKA